MKHLWEKISVYFFSFVTSGGAYSYSTFEGRQLRRHVTAAPGVAGSADHSGAHGAPAPVLASHDGAGACGCAGTGRGEGAGS
jgi:hypothetical protein